MMYEELIDDLTTIINAAENSGMKLKDPVILKDPIKKGKFHFATHPPIEGEILYAPSGQGDCWIVLDEYGLKHWIRQFDFMTETPPDPTKK